MLIEALDYATRGVSLDEKLTPLNTWDSNLRVFFFKFRSVGTNPFVESLFGEKKTQ